VRNVVLPKETARTPQDREEPVDVARPTRNAAGLPPARRPTRGRLHVGHGLCLRERVQPALRHLLDRLRAPGTEEDGGPGALEAFAEVAGAGYAGVAHTIFTGPYALPELSAYAFAEVIVPGGTDFRTYFYEAMGSASGLQQYTYGGAAPETYTITYTLDGEFTLTAADAASLMSVYGGITVYSHPYEPFGEVHPNYGYDYQGDHAELVGTHPFLLTGSVTFTVQPGDIFYVYASLYATADSSHQVTGAADALHTLALEFTSGDPSLLTPRPRRSPSRARSRWSAWGWG